MSKIIKIMEITIGIDGKFCSWPGCQFCFSGEDGFYCALFESDLATDEETGEIVSRCVECLGSFPVPVAQKAGQ